MAQERWLEAETAVDCFLDDLLTAVCVEVEEHEKAILARANIFAVCSSVLQCWQVVGLGTLKPQPLGPRPQAEEEPIAAPIDCLATRWIETRKEAVASSDLVLPMMPVRRMDSAGGSIGKSSVASHRSTRHRRKPADVVDAETTAIFDRIIRARYSDCVSHSEGRGHQAQSRQLRKQLVEEDQLRHAALLKRAAVVACEAGEADEVEKARLKIAQLHGRPYTYDENGNIIVLLPTRPQAAGAGVGFAIKESEQKKTVASRRSIPASEKGSVVSLWKSASKSSQVKARLGLDDSSFFTPSVDAAAGVAKAVGIELAPGVSNRGRAAKRPPKDPLRMSRADYESLKSNADDHVMGIAERLSNTSIVHPPIQPRTTFSPPQTPSPRRSRSPEKKEVMFFGAFGGDDVASVVTMASIAAIDSFQGARQRAVVKEQDEEEEEDEALLLRNQGPSLVPRQPAKVVPRKRHFHAARALNVAPQLGPRIRVEARHPHDAKPHAPSTRLLPNLPSGASVASAASSRRPASSLKQHPSALTMDPDEDSATIASRSARSARTSL